MRQGAEPPVERVPLGPVLREEREGVRHLEPFTIDVVVVSDLPVRRQPAHPVERLPLDVVGDVP